MGYKERRVKMIAARAEPYLEPGEQIQTGYEALREMRHDDGER